MELLLTRQRQTDDATLGQLFIDGSFFCWTLEPSEDRPGHPAIPCGRYTVIITPSIRFKRMLPLITNVPGRYGIRIHPGNTAEDTEGCILLGMAQVGDVVESSRAACELFQAKIAPVLARQDRVWLTVQDAPVTKAA